MRWLDNTDWPINIHWLVVIIAKRAHMWKGSFARRNCIGEENTLLIRHSIIPAQHVPELLLRYAFLYGYLYGGRGVRGRWNVYDVLHDGQRDKAVARMGIGQPTWGFNMQILWTISSVCIVKHYFMYCKRHPIFLKLFKNCSQTCFVVPLSLGFCFLNLLIRFMRSCCCQKRYLVPTSWISVVTLKK